MLYTLVALVVAVAAQDDPVKAAKSVQLTDEIKKVHTARGVSRLLYVNQERGNEQGRAMIGGNTKMNGDVGILYLIEKAEDVTSFVSWMATTSADAYVTLLAESVLAESDKNTLHELNKTGKLAGVIMYDDDDGSSTQQPYSPGNCQPNADYGIPFTLDTKWNNANENCEKLGMHWQDLDMPFFFLPDKADVFGENGLYNYTKLHNFVDGSQATDKFPLAGVKMTFFAWGSPNSVTCSRRDYCDPIGGQNVLGFLRPYQEGEDVVVVAAPSDAVALFHDDAYGIDAHAASVVTLLAAAKLVGDLADRTTANVPDNVLFTLFSGERFGYTGSSSMGQRINSTTTFPATGAQMKAENIKYYIELDQLMDADSGDTEQWYIHTDKVGNGNANNAATAAAVANLVNNDGDATFVEATLGEMPPSSFRGLFGELDTQRSTVGAVVISNYDQMFTNKNFESQYDAASDFGFDADLTSDNKYIQQLCSLAHKVALAAVSFANTDADGEPTAPTTAALGDTADCDYITDLIKMIAVNRAEAAGDATAKIGSTYLAEGLGQAPVPLSRYVGVFQASALATHELAFFMQLSYALRNRGDSDVNTKMPGKYCHLVKGKKTCNADRTEADGTTKRLCLGVETIFSTKGNCTTWNANVDEKGILLPAQGMYDKCIKDNAPTSGAAGGGDAPKQQLVSTGAGALAAYTGRTSWYCSPKARKGVKEDKNDANEYPPFLECKDKPKGDKGNRPFVYLDSEYTAAMNWNWVQTYPADRENCADGACDTICMKTSVSWMDAPSPALKEDYSRVTLIGEGKTAVLENPRWSTWTESTWDADPTLESFLVSAPKADNAILGGGIGYFIFSIFIVWIVNKNVEIVEE